MKNTELVNAGDDYLELTLTIEHFFERHKRGGYLFAVTGSFHLRKQVNSQVIEFGRKKDLIIKELDLVLAGEQGLQSQFNKAAEEATGGLIINSIDSLMIETKGEFAYELNHLREILLSLKRPMLFWLNSDSHRIITHRAVDLYTRRDLDTLFFPDLKTDGDGLIAERAQMHFSESVADPEEVRTKIALLNRQLENARVDQSFPRKRIATEVVLPLIKEYRRLLLLDQALKLRAEFENDFDPSDSNALFEFGKLSTEGAEYDKAISYYEKALDIDKKIYGEEFRNIVSIHNEIGIVLKAKGEYDKALTYFEKALTLSEKLYSKDHAKNASFYNNIGSAYESKGEYDKAISYYEKSLSIVKNIEEEDSINAANRYNNIGGAYFQKGEHDKAINYYEKSLAIDKRLYGEEHPSIAVSLSNIGLVYDDKGEHDKAVSNFEKAIEIEKKFYGEGHPEIAAYYNNIGLTYNNKGEYDKALRYLEKCLTLLNKFFPNGHPYIDTVKENLMSARQGMEEKNNRK